MIAPGVSLTMSNPPIMFVNTYDPVTSDDMATVSKSLQNKLIELLSLKKGDIELVHVHKPQHDR